MSRLIKRAFSSPLLPPKTKKTTSQLTENGFLGFLNIKRGIYTEYIEKSSADTQKQSESEKSQQYSQESTDHELYKGHIPTSLFQKTLLSVGSAAVAITSPWRDDMIATMGETTGYYSLIAIRKKMQNDSVGRQILEEKPRINTDNVDLSYLKSLPEGTFGKLYSDFLGKYGLNPDSRRLVHFVDDLELAYVMQRYRDVHDLLHTVLGMPTNMLGEIVVKWVEAIQTGLPMCVTGALFGPVRLKTKHRQKYLDTHLWWAIRNGQNANFLMNVYYEKHWDMPIEELRKELNLEEPPNTPEKIKT